MTSPGVTLRNLRLVGIKASTDSQVVTNPGEALEAKQEDAESRS